MKLTERDKKLLLGLAIVLILTIPYITVIQPLSNRLESMSEEEKGLQRDLQEITELANNQQFYEDEILRFTEETESIYAKFPANIEQESSILFFNEAEKLMPIKLPSINFAQKEVIPFVTEPIAAEASETAENTGTEEALAPVEGTAANQTGLNLVKTVTQFSYEAEYTQFKNFLNYIKVTEDRMAITSLNATYDGEMVTGDFSLTEYALQGTDKELKTPPVLNMEVGVGNVFDSEVLGKNEISYSVSDTQNDNSYDVFLLLNQPNADIPATVIGRSNDPSETSYLENAKNEKQKIEILFEGEKGNYTVSYKLGDKQYPKNEAENEKISGEELHFQILSSKRMNETDKVSAEVAVINHTDISLTVTIANDDKQNPRVKIEGTTGDVVIK